MKRQQSNYLLDFDMDFYGLSRLAMALKPDVSE